MRRIHHDVASGRGRYLSAALAAALCCAVLITAPLQADWGDSEYGDIFASQTKSHSNKVEKPAAPVAQQHSDRYPDTLSSLHPTASPLDKAVMHNESIRGALDQYHSSSSQERLKQVYKKNSYKHLWSRRGRVSGDANAAIQVLSEAASHGLNPAEYHVDKIVRAKERGDMTLFDVLLTENVLRYVIHLRDGQYRKEDVDPQWEIRSGARPDLAEGLAKAIKRKDALRYMKQAPPRHAVYSSLRRHLNEYSGIAESGGWPSFPVRGREIKPGASGSQVKALRARLAVTDGADLYVPQPSRFDNDLKLAVQKFQRRHGLNDDGNVGGRTRQALAVPVKDRIRQIIAAMERWRWVPDNIGKRHVMVNVPAFRLYYRENGVDKLTMRTIVGKAPKDLQTPTFTTNMKYMVLNPNWNVPNSIVSEEMAPRASKYPGYFQEKGYKVTDEAGNAVDPADVDWGQYSKSNPVPYKVVQARGGDGALGSVKFIFPNHYGVALHDTQRKNLFNEEFRAYSHGCVRVAEPAELGAAILGHRSPMQFSALVEESSEDQRIDLQRDIPVYMVYMTAWADAVQVYFYEDLYRRDRRLVQATTSKRG